MRRQFQQWLYIFNIHTCIYKVFGPNPPPSFSNIYLVLLSKPNTDGPSVYHYSSESVIVLSIFILLLQSNPHPAPILPQLLCPCMEFNPRLSHTCSNHQSKGEWLAISPGVNSWLQPPKEAKHLFTTESLHSSPSWVLPLESREPNLMPWDAGQHPTYQAFSLGDPQLASKS